MYINRDGATRIVFVFKNFVIKIPVWRSWLNFLNGLLANITEGQTWKYNQYDDCRIGCEKIRNMICPVLYFNRLGLVTIMRRADKLPHNYPINYHDYSGLCSDLKDDNFGLLDGKLVVIDYGSR
jgi:hypothetical protein